MKNDNPNNCLTPEEARALQEIQAKIAAARKEKAKVYKRTYETKRRNAQAAVLVRIDKALHDHVQTENERVSHLLREIAEAAAIHALQNGLSFRQALDLAMGQFSASTPEISSRQPLIDPSVIDALS